MRVSYSDAAFNKALEFCEAGKHTLLYLTRYGSHLYGTNTERSDQDFKGLYLPNIDNLILCKKLEPYKFKTATDDVKNTESDWEVQLYPIQTWLNVLVKNGETEGIELLYSYTYRGAVIYCNSLMEDVFSYKGSLFDPVNCQAFIGFAVSQAAKYFTKAERYSVIKNIYDYAYNILKDKKIAEKTKVKEVFDEIINRFYHPSYCLEITNGNIRSLEICGKIHQESIGLDEFVYRLAKSVKHYGHRTVTAAEMNFADYKSLSHALKALYVVESLYETHAISFPFPTEISSILTDIKNGLVPVEKIESMIEGKIQRVNELRRGFDVPQWKYKEDVVLELFKKFYNI
jgi:predicted nucleotidyltransferase